MLTYVLCICTVYPDQQMYKTHTHTNTHTYTHTHIYIYIYFIYRKYSYMFRCICIIFRKSYPSICRRRRPPEDYADASKHVGALTYTKYR